MVLAAAATASAGDLLDVGDRKPLPVRLQIEVPASLSTVRLGIGIGGAGALVEPREAGFDFVWRSAVRPSPAVPGPLDRLERFLDRSPFNLGEFGPSEPGWQLELFNPGDIGASLRYRW